MKYFAVLAIVVLLAGCESTAVKSASAVKTKAKINQNISLPVASKVAYYVDKSVTEKKVNFYGKMEEALELVTSDLFSETGLLNSQSDFDYLLKVATTSKWDYVWGGWESIIELNVIDRSGKQVFSRSFEQQASGTGGFYDMNAVFNSFAAGVKGSLIDFLNAHHSKLIVNNSDSPKADIKAFFSNMEAGTTGTGFFVNKKGQSVTAAHVVEDCVYIELRHKGQTLPAVIHSSSQLLDLAVLNVDYQNQATVSIEPETSDTLGKQVFVTGYPLAGILSDYPSLTIGNISSKGGLKGAQGIFQFSAPTQPGNSGGAITDYSGNLMGVVSSSLNQRMMLQNTNTTSQNVNFGINSALVKRFLDKHKVEYKPSVSKTDFEKSSAIAVEYSNQILCYK